MKNMTNHQKGDVLEHLCLILRKYLGKAESAGERDPADTQYLKICYRSIAPGVRSTVEITLKVPGCI